MAEYFPGFGHESSAEDDDDESLEKKTSKKAEKSTSKERKADDKIEKKDRDDAVPLEKLADDETSVIAAELARLRAEAARQELAETPETSIEHNEASAVAEFDDALQINLEDGQTFEEAIENAEAVVIEHLDDEIAQESDELVDIDVTEVDENLTVEASENDDVTEDDDGAPTPTPAPVPSTAAPLTPQGSGAGGNYNPQPTASVSPTFNAPTAANTPPKQPETNSSVAPYVLTGGLIGYLMGRRRGRIKTEKRLLPIQKNLEKEVSKLEKLIIVREDKIRSLTRKQMRANAERPSPAPERKSDHSTATKAEAPEPVITSPNQEKVASTEAIAMSPKARVATEKLGKLAFIQETNSVPRQEQRQKPVEIMTIPEVLTIAKQIKVEQIDVKRLYETGRLDDRGLRRVVRAFLNGEAYRKVLHEELRSPEEISLEHESLQQNGATRPGNQGGSSEPSHYSSEEVPISHYVARPSAVNPSSQPFANTSNRDAKKATLNRPIIVTLVVAAAGLLLLFLLARG